MTSNKGNVPMKKYVSKEHNHNGIIFTLVVFFVLFFSMAMWEQSRITNLEDRLENTPKKVCDTIEKDEFVIFGDNINYHRFKEGSKVNCEEGVEVNYGLHNIRFDKYVYCGLPFCNGDIDCYNYYNDSNTGFWYNYYKCKEETKKACTITWEEEVCRIE